MGNSNHKETKKNVDSHKSIHTNVNTSDQQQVSEIDFSDLIEQAQRTSVNPIGATERQLILALEVFSLLDHAPSFTSSNDKKNDPSRSTSSTNKTPSSSSSTSSSSITFSEMVKWSVLSMLRNCSVCSDGRRPHCSEHRQALILPPFKSPGPPGGVGKRLEHPLFDPFFNDDTTDEPSLRFICDSCLEMVHIPRYEAIQAEIKKVAMRTRGFAAGTMKIDLVDGPSVCGRDPACFSQDESEPTQGVVTVQNNLLLSANSQHDDDGENHNNDNGHGDGDDDDGGHHETVCVNGVVLGGASLSHETVALVLRNSDLNRVSINFPNNGPNATVINMNLIDGKFCSLLAKNEKVIKAVRSIRELRLTSGSILPSDEGRKNGTFPLKLFSNLQRLTMSGYPLTRKDLDHIIEGLLDFDNNSNKNQKSCNNASSKGCQFLEQVVFVNQPSLKLDDILDTIGQLPLSLLSVANMTSIMDSPDNENNNNNNNNNNNRSTNSQRQEKPPILVSQIIMWGSSASLKWMARELLPRSQFLTSIDVSRTRIYVSQFLDACAGAGLSLLRTVRANGCTGNSEDNSGDPNFMYNKNDFSTNVVDDNNNSNSASGGFLMQDGVRKQITTWDALASLSTLQMQKLQVRSSPGQLEKLTTLPSLTFVDVSFDSASNEDPFVHPSVLGQLKMLFTLNIQGSTRGTAYYGGAAPVPRRKNGNAVDSSSLCLPNLTHLHFHSHPPFRFTFSGAPRLQKLIFSGSQHNDVIREFIQEGAGRNVEDLSFNGEPGNPSIQLPLDGCPKLKKLSIHHFSYFSASTVAALASCVNLRCLDLSDLKSSTSISQAFSIEQALSGMTKLEELDLSNTGRALYFTGKVLREKTNQPSGASSSSSSSAFSVAQEYFILPSLKKFWKREDNRGGSSPSISSPFFPGSQPSGESINLLEWLQFQPNLEEIDIEGACVSASDFSGFWTSSAMQNKVTYLNIANVVGPTNFGFQHESVWSWYSSEKNRPKQLKVLKWFHGWSGDNVEKILSDISSLRYLEIGNLQVGEEEKKKTGRKDEMVTIWSEQFVKQMIKKGVVLKNAQGHSYVKSFQWK